MKETNMPKHIAFIMDGNRRWAVQHGLNKMAGHKKGAAVMKHMVELLCEYKDIKYASFFLFSTENWKREKKERDFIFDLAYDLLVENEKLWQEKQIKLVAMGDISKFPDKLKNQLIKVMKNSKNNTGLVVNLALNYGGRDDIAQAAQKVVDCHEEMTVENIGKHLYSYPAPDIDLLIRTSGEMRLSNFMLFQLAYSELYFTKSFWPVFSKRTLDKALKAYSKRNRRFGGQ